MSVHGNQHLLPFLITKDLNQSSIKDKAELALAFYLLTKNIKKEEKLLSFSRILWPFLSIQGVISTHIFLDGLIVFSKKDKFTNPPRQPLIGHILRNIDNRTEVELLTRIIEILTYKDKDAEKIGTISESEETEFQKMFVSGLINPDYLQSLLKLIPHIDYLPITDYTVLDTSLSTESALDISEKYRLYIETMKGNALRWESMIKLIEHEIEKWLIDLNVKIKDIELRYSSKISKLKESVEDNQVNKQKDMNFDKIEQWNVKEKKNIIENISVLFKTLERQLLDIVKKNRFFSDEESLKSKVFEDLIHPYEDHFDFLKIQAANIKDSIENLYQKFTELKIQAQNIDADTAKKLQDITTEAQLRIETRDIQLSELDNEKEESLEELNKHKFQIEELYLKIKDTVKKKVQNCLNEAEELKGWSIKDTEDELFSKPIQWTYMPLYVILTEDENLMEEKMDFLFPGYIGSDPNLLYEDISDSFKEMKQNLIEMVENDVKLRSNFEFSSENKNLINDLNFKNEIKMGISLLKNKSLFNSEIEQRINDIINDLT